MAVTSFEVVTISADNLEPAKLLWRRYQKPTPGLYGVMLDRNPELVDALRDGPYAPIGMSVLIPIDADLLAGRPTVTELPSLL